VISLWDAD
jgi:hypothetical protein